MKTLNARLYSSFFDGMSRVLDVGATHSLRSSIRRKYFLSTKRLHRSDLLFLDRANLVDSFAIASDWSAVGKDIKSAIFQYAQVKK
jgi:hypothetical protein